MVSMRMESREMVDGSLRKLYDYDDTVYQVKNRYTFVDSEDTIDTWCNVNGMNKSNGQ
jgi:hypothetical protein